MLLASAVLQALRRGEDIGANSVALPAISTGVFGFPLEHGGGDLDRRGALLCSVGAEYVERIVFCLLDDKTHEVFEAALKKA